MRTEFAIGTSITGDPMERREFVAAGLSSLLTYTCSCSRLAMANPIVRGCRMALAGDNAFLSRIWHLTEDNPVHAFCRRAGTFFSERFAVRPGLCFYDDADGRNALATTEVFFEDGPQGTVMLGNRLVADEIKALRDNRMWWAKYHSMDQAIAQVILVITGHEFGHILQYKNGMTEDGPWQMEPHADFLAGWLIAQIPQYGKKHNIFLTHYVEVAVMTLFALGDTEFNSPEHHGQPEFRAAMVRAGYDAGELGLAAAFDKGNEMAHLEPPRLLPPSGPRWK